jgi:hypothetical protein
VVDVSTSAPFAPFRSAPVVMRSSSSVMVRKGFRFAREFAAFTRVASGEVIATDDVVGTITCQHAGGAFIVMPTRLPFEGEEAWYWGFPVA